MCSGGCCCVTSLMTAWIHRLEVSCVFVCWRREFSVVWGEMWSYQWCCLQRSEAGSLLALSPVPRCHASLLLGPIGALNRCWSWFWLVIEVLLTLLIQDQPNISCVRTNLLWYPFLLYEHILLDSNMFSDHILTVPEGLARGYSWYSTE